MIRTIIISIALVAAGCGGSSDDPPRPATLQSSGGNWVGSNSMGGPVNLLISESGKLRAIFSITDDVVPTIFGSGTVSVSGTDIVTGAMRAENFGLVGLFPANGATTLLPPIVESCSIAGTVRERTRLTIDVICSNDVDIVFDERLALSATADYQSGSSLAELAGNYAMRFRPESDMLNITSDGTIFGTYGISPGCTINGQATEIDTRFNMLDVAWTLSACADPYGTFEGGEFDGFAMKLPASVDPGSYSFFLVREQPEYLSLISTIYDPT